MNSDRIERLERPQSVYNREVKGIRLRWIVEFQL